MASRQGETHGGIKALAWITNSVIIKLKLAD